MAQISDYGFPLSSQYPYRLTHTQFAIKIDQINESKRGSLHGMAVQTKSTMGESTRGESRIEIESNCMLRVQ